MSEPIGVGDFVECVKANATTSVGGVYRVKEIYRRWPCEKCWNDGCKEPFLLFCDAEPERGFIGHCVHRFRLIHRPSKSTFLQSLLQPVKEDAR